MIGIRFIRRLGASLLACSIVTVMAAASASANVRLETGSYVGIAAADEWSFRLHGAAPGQRYAYEVTGRGRTAVRGRGVVAEDSHAQAVDLSVFRRGEIRVRVTLYDAAGDPTASLIGTVWKDPAYPAGYL